MGICVCVISGNVTRDAEMRQTSNGKTVTNFTLAYNLRRMKQGEWQYVPNYLDVKIWGTYGEKVCERLVKGAAVTVVGELEQSTWEKDGIKRTKFEIIASTVDVQKRTNAPKDDQYQASLYDSDCPF
jgi:single-strand DNA-binding protein